ncbi:restriction endonuclease subunit S [Aquimarina spinulae]|uniref:restriction endonuclease subunit S n=1 Tax=Aquimarina spinulae TaxID=1192023 RepID=UPI000D551959|nr:restriction endonuclease subunit S [Aquimarina spinulae]
MNTIKLKDLVLKPILGEWGKEESESPLGNGIVNVIRTANFLPTGKIDYSNITQRAILKKKKTESGDIWIADENKIENKQLKHKDLIIEKSGGGPKTPVGRVVLFESDDDIYLCSNFLSVLRVKEGIVIPEYLLYQFRYLYQINKVKKYQNQTTGIYNLKLGRYLDVEIDLPPKSDQSVIVAQLSKIQELIDKRIKTIGLLDKYIRSVFLEMFGDPVLNEKKFDQIKLSDKRFSLKSGITPSRKESMYFNGTIPWVKSTDINSVFIEKTDEYITELALQKTTAKVYPKNSILIAMYGQGSTRGKVAILNTEASCNQACAIIFPNKIISPLYLLHQFKYSYSYLRSLGKGGNQNNLSLKVLGDVKVNIPSNKLQEQFERKFLEVTSQKQKYQQSLELLENLFEVTLHNAFSIEEEIDEEKLFENIIQDFKVEDFKKGQRIQYLINWLKKDKKKELFSDIEKYNLALESLFLLLEDGSIEQYLDGKEIKLKKAL